MTFMATLPPLPQQYSLVQVRSDDKERSRRYIDGWMRRVELPSRNEIVITRPDLGLLWLLDTRAKTFSKRKLRLPTGKLLNPDTLCDWTHTGSESIDGRPHLRFVGRYIERDFGGAHEVCFIDPISCIRRRVLTYDKMGELRLTIDSLEVVVGPPPAEVFDLPGEYTRARFLRA